MVLHVKTHLLNTLQTNPLTTQHTYISQAPLHHDCSTVLALHTLTVLAGTAGLFHGHLRDLLWGITHRGDLQDGFV